MGRSIKKWRDQESSMITLVITQECQLRCKYCYETSKNDQNNMTFQTGKDIIDFVFAHKEELKLKDALALCFIGGEPLLQIDLMDQLVDYFKLKSYKENSSWFGAYSIAISTNGILYTSEKVQRFIRKNRTKVSVGISIDGTKQKHDAQRVYPDGRGSYDDVAKSVAIWIKQFPNYPTKVTIAHSDLPYLKESIIHLWNLGIRQVPANTVFEDIWEDGDDVILENQLNELADYIIERHLWEDYSTTLFSVFDAVRRSGEAKVRPVCASQEIAFDSNGNIYPCLRYMQHSLDEKLAFIYGNIYEEFNSDKRRALECLCEDVIAPEKCRECSVSNGCSPCQAVNYIDTDGRTNYNRALYSCDMHKARSRSIRYFWSRLQHSIGNEFYYGMMYHNKKINILLSDKSVAYCHYPKSSGNSELSAENFVKVLSFCRKEFFLPVIIHPIREIDSYGRLIVNPEVSKELERQVVRHIYSYESNYYRKTASSIYVFNESNIDDPILGNIQNCILVVDEKSMDKLAVWACKLLDDSLRINLRTCIHKRFSKVWRCEILITASAESTVIS